MHDTHRPAIFDQVLVKLPIHRVVLRKAINQPDAALSLDGTIENMISVAFRIADTADADAQVHLDRNQQGIMLQCRRRRILFGDQQEYAVSPTPDSDQGLCQCQCLMDIRQYTKHDSQGLPPR